MKIGFVFGVRLKKYKDDYYSVNLPNELLKERYLFSPENEIVVVCRYCNATNEVLGKLLKTNGDNVSVRAIPDTSVLGRLKGLFKEQDFIEKSIADCDVVICRGTWGVKACRKLNKKYLVEVVSCTWDAMYNHGLLGKINAPFAFIKTRRKIKQAPYVIYVTNEFLQRRYPTKGQTVGISNVVLTSFDEAVLQQRLHKIENMNTQDRPIVLGTAAAVNVKYKGQWNVIEALAILKKMGKTNYRYVLAGGGDQEYLKEVAAKYGVEDQIEFVGSVVKDNMPDWYDGIDVYIQPSLQEGLPRALIEAMSRGLPALGSRTGGIPELLEPEYVCKNNRRMARQFADMLESLTQEKMLGMAQRNYEESKKYDAKLLAQRRKNFLEKFIQNK